MDAPATTINSSDRYALLALLAGVALPLLPGHGIPSAAMVPIRLMLLLCAWCFGNNNATWQHHLEWSGNCEITVWQRILYAIASAVLLVVAVTALNFAVRWLCGIQEPQQLVAFYQNAPLSKLLLMACTTLVFAPLFEELAYRVLFPRCLKSLCASPLFYQGAAALIFALLHPLWGVPGMLLFASLQFYLKKRWGICQCVLTHAIYNATCLAVALLFN